MEKIDLTGQRFGQLIVLQRNGKNRHNHTKWKCKCACGNHTTVTTSNLKNGSTISCGCLRAEWKKKIGQQNKTHGMTGTRIHNIYRGMKARCYIKTSKHYNRYGGRGIKICDEWLEDFMNFYKWAINNGYREDLTIDRIDNNKDYSPSNCRWTTRKQQVNNTSRNIVVTVGGETHTIAEWSETTGIHRSTLVSRYLKKRSPEDFLKEADKRFGRKVIND